VTKTDNFSTGVCSQTIFYTIEIKNSGTASALGANFTDTPDANSSLVIGSVSTSKGAVTTGNTAGNTSVAVNIGNIVTGETVTIKFSVVVNNGVFPTTTTINNQGTVSGSNFSNLLTSDPDQATYFQTTETDLNVFFGSLTLSCPANKQVAFGNNCQFVLANYSAQASSSDFCNTLNVSQNPLSGGSYGGTTTVTLTGTDALGRSGSCSFEVIPSDQTAPTINCPGNISQNNDAGDCSAIVTYAVTTADNCPNESLSQTDGVISGASFPVGTTSNSFTVTDASGNTASCSFDVTVVDAELPTISCPSSISQNNDQGNCSAVVTYSVTTADNCPNESLSGLPSGTSFPVGTTTNSFTVTDASGNTASCSFQVIITDNELPTITCPANIQWNNNPGLCFARVIFSVPTSDNCPNESLNQNNGLPAGAYYPVGTTLNTYTVTDAGGNTASCSFEVSIIDVELPTITCLAPVNLSNEPGKCSRKIVYLPPVGEDNCNSTTSLIGGLGSGSDYPVGQTIEKYQVTDASGNTASCSFSITINDTENPTLNLQGDNPLILCEGDSYVEAGAGASDNCDPNVAQNVLIDDSDVNTNVEGSYTVTYDVIDASGNSAIQLTRIVIVNHTPAQLDPQNCNNCNQIRLDYCQFDTPPDLEHSLTFNPKFEILASFLWYEDNNGVQGNPIGNPTVNTNQTSRTFYWVSQLDGDCEGPARRVRVRVRATSLVVFDLPELGCAGGQLDLAEWVSDSRKKATAFSFYDGDPNGGGSLLGSVSATKGQVDIGQHLIVNLPGQAIRYYATATNNTGCQVTGSEVVNSASGASLDPVANITVTSGDLVHVAFNSVDATHIVWVDHSSFNNPSIGLIGITGLGDLIFTASHTSNTAQTALIRVIAYNNTCAGQVRDFYITVNPGTGSRQAKNSLQLAAMKLNAHDVKINWEINYEFALERIEIEKQKNEGEWETVDHHDVGSHYNVTGQNGSHYNVTLHHGSYLDESGMGNVTKYRLKLIHEDGRVIWSQAVEVTFDFYENKRFTLYPSPTTGRFNLQATGSLEGTWSYILTDQLGRTILIDQLQDSETAIDITDQPAGHYYLVLKNATGKRYVKKVVKK